MKFNRAFIDETLNDRLRILMDRKWKAAFFSDTDSRLTKYDAVTFTNEIVRCKGTVKTKVIKSGRIAYLKVKSGKLEVTASISEMTFISTDLVKGSTIDFFLFMW